MEIFQDEDEAVGISSFLLNKMSGISYCLGCFLCSFPKLKPKCKSQNKNKN